MWDIITGWRANFSNSLTKPPLQFGVCMSNYIPLFYMDVIIYHAYGSDFIVIPTAHPTYHVHGLNLWFMVTTGHYGDVIMGAMASQITSFTIVYSIVYSDADQRQHQSSASVQWHWAKHTTYPATVNWPWEIWVNNSHGFHKKTNIITTKQSIRIPVHTLQDILKVHEELLFNLRRRHIS